MNMRAIFFTCACLLLWAESVNAQSKSIDEIRFEKVGINTSLAEFLKLHPKAVLESTEEDKFGVKSFELVDHAEGTRSGFQFFEGKLLTMLIVWSDSGVNNAGGVDKILERIVKTYGKADANTSTANRYVFGWSSKSSKNNLAFIYDKKSLIVGMSVENVKEQLSDHKAKLAKKKIDD